MTFSPSRSGFSATGERVPLRQFAEWNRDMVEETRERIMDAMQSGALCGTPIPAPMATCLLKLLDHLGWVPDYASMAKAMPHLPEQFTLDMMRDVCARLGFPSDMQRLRSREVEPLRLPALVLGKEPLLATTDEDGNIATEELGTGRRRRLMPWRRHTFAFFGNTERMATQTEGSWMRGLLRRLRGSIAQLFVLTFLINALTLALSLTIMTIYDLVLPAMAYDTLVAITLGALIVLAVELALRRLRAQLLGHMSGRIEYAVGSALFSKILSLPLERTNTVPISTQSARLKQFETVRELFAGSLGIVLLELPFALVFTGILFLLVGPIGFVPLALVIVSAVLAAALTPATRRYASEAQAARTAHYELYLDTLANLRTVRNLGCEVQWAERLDDAALKAARSRRAALECKRFLAGLSATAPPLAGGATVAIGALMVMEGTLSTGALIACMLVVWRIVAPIQQALLFLPRLSDLGQLVSQIDTLMAMPGEDDQPAPHRLTRRSHGRVTLARASFRYPGATDPAIAAVDLDIAAGEFVAVSGSSGAGKTTLLHLMQGLVTPQAGVVALDGRNIRQLPIADVRTAVGFVAHRPVFFHGTIAQNLRLAAPAASDVEIEAVAEELGILNLVRALPEGFDTRLTEERQERLPRGARQALAIARTLLRNPPVLLLDEPAQSLDPTLERAFLAAITSRRGRSTIVMVSHRPSHIKLADRSVILDRGRIVSQSRPASQSGENSP